MIGGTTVSPTSGIMGSQDIVSIHGSTGSTEVRDTHKFDASVDGNLAENGDYTPIFRKLIGRELSHNSSSDIYLHCKVDFTRNAVGTKSPDFMQLGPQAINTSD